LIEKERSSREIVEIVGLSQSIINRVRKQLSCNLELSKRGHPKVLIEWEKWYASCLVIASGLETTTKATKVLKRETSIEMCDNTLRNVLREQGLSSIIKVENYALS